MKTWNQETKDKFLKMAKSSAELNAFKQGQWLNDEVKAGAFCGCMHGRLTQLNEGVLEESSKYMSWPLWLTYLSERVFEGLKEGECSEFVVNLIEAVPVECNLDPVLAKINIARMNRLKLLNPSMSKIFDGVIESWELLLSGSIDEAESAARSAESAAKSAAWWAARSARSSAWSAAWSAESAARSAAESAEYSARSARVAESAAESAGWLAWYGKELQKEDAWSEEAKTLISELTRGCDCEFA